MPFSVMDGGWGGSGLGREAWCGLEWGWGGSGGLF